MAYWLGLASLASVMFLAVTNEVCQNVATVPLLWVVPLSLYLWSGSTSQSGHSFDVWHRVIGVEWSQSVGPIALAGTPAARAQIGVGESLNAPFRRKVRGYVSLVLNP